MHSAPALSPSPQTQRRWWPWPQIQPLQALAWCTACAVGMAALLAVFALYTEPDFLITLANMAWTCF